MSAPLGLSDGIKFKLPAPLLDLEASGVAWFPLALMVPWLLARAHCPL